VRQCPAVRFALDHSAQPDIRAGRLDPWRTELREWARMDNVWCKLSGLATEGDQAKWTRAICSLRSTTSWSALGLIA
jgi:L-fuconolactonase